MHLLMLMQRGWVFSGNGSFEFRLQHAILGDFIAYEGTVLGKTCGSKISARPTVGFLSPLKLSWVASMCRWICEQNERFFLSIAMWNRSAAACEFLTGKRNIET